MHKPKKRSDAVSSSIRLPRDLHEWLNNQPGGITDTIKRGFEMLRFAEGADEPTRQLAAVLFGMAHEVELEVGQAWHADPGAYRTLQRAIRMALAKWRPEGVPDSMIEKVELAPFEERPRATHSTNDTDNLGIAIAHDVLELPDPIVRARVRAAREKTLQDILKLHQTAGEEGND
jgi:hypothetical protein